MTEFYDLLLYLHKSICCAFRYVVDCRSQ